MCGIAGSILSQHDNNAALYIRNCVQKLTHRGPDYQHTIDLGEAQLGHARLSIIDTQAHANQPMFSQDKRYCLVFNGEIYNYLEIKKELILLNHQFYTESDTEVLLHAWQQWGTDSLQKLIGMFAFAIWDSLDKKLYLARDRMGEKPLYYSLANGIIFASELNALASHPLIPKEINYQAINQFLSLNYILTNQCIFKHVHKLPPAHYLIYKVGSSPNIKCYWDLASIVKEPKKNISFIEHQNKFLNLYDQAVARQLRSDVNLGAFLSGGLDSSAIVTSMLKSTTTKHVKTFSMDFNQSSYSELPFSTAVANFLNVEHNTQQTTIEHIEDILNPLKAYGEPFADTSLIPCYYLAQFTRNSVAVALSGDGGDELFAGYETYTADRYYRLLRHLPASVKRAAYHIINQYMPSSFNKVSLDFKLKQFLTGLNYDYQRAHYSWRQIFSEQNKHALCNPSLLKQFAYDPFEDYKRAYHDVSDCHWLDQSTYVDIKNWLADDILVKVDRSSMAHSLEVRSPFLDHTLVEYSASLPHHWKLKGRHKKYFLKQSQHNRLPKNIIYRKKSGFNSPVSYWLTQQSLAQEIKSRLNTPAMCNFFNQNYLNKLWLDHQNKTKDNSLKIFGLLSLSQWLTRFN